MRNQHTRNRVRDRPKTAQQDNIDNQILCLHKAMTEKLIANQHYMPQVLQTIETRYKSGKMRYGAYLFWSSLMEHIHQPELFMTTVLDNSPQTQKYRRQTPFVGILTEQERQAALDQMTFT
jgi:hypothetical protein